jgi:glycosyltransferase involved in cell wall biosynthesis
VARVLIIPQYPAYGGTRTFFLKLLRIHQRHDLQTAVLLAEEYTDPVVLRLCADTGVEVFLAPRRGKLSSRAYFSLLHDLRAARTVLRSFRPDLIVVSSAGLFEMLGVLALPVPVLFVMHTSLPAAVRTRKTVGVRLFVRLMCRVRKNHFVSVSRSAARGLQEGIGVREGSLTVVYNSARAVSVSRAKKQEVVLTVGHITAYKNPGTWLEVARRVLAAHPTVRFVWLGDGDRLEEILGAVRDLGPERRIVLPGYSPDVHDYYAEAMIYFQPSRIESHGIGVVEAMAHGLPCVTSDVGGLPERMVGGETGFTCRPDDVGGFCAHIAELLDNPELRQSMGEASRQRARTLFSEERQEEEFLRLYRSLAPRAWPGEHAESGSPFTRTGGRAGGLTTMKPGEHV